MANVIRNYRAGTRITVDRWIRENGVPAQSPEQKRREALEQALAEAEALRDQAAAELEQAREQADRLMEQAQAQVDTLAAEAQARGYEEGYQNGLREGEGSVTNAMADAVGQMQAIVASLSDERSALLRSTESEVSGLAMAIAESIVGRLGESQGLVVHTVRRALASLDATGPFEIGVHPDDHAYLEKHWDEVALPGERAAWTIRSDETIRPGGCLLRCGPASVDARLSTQLRALVDGLMLTNYQPLDNGAVNPADDAPSPDPSDASVFSADTHFNDSPPADSPPTELLDGEVPPETGQ